MSAPIRLGISTCPNDTFAFHAILEKCIDLQGLTFDIQLLDIQQLNEGLARRQFDVVKASFHAALDHAQDHWVLPSGSALGFGVGPLLLAAKPNTLPTNLSQLTLCPGAQTTAQLLFQMFYPNSTRIEQTLFSDIMPRLQQGTADFGVCIHEGRFTWQSQHLACVEDLGTRWEQTTHLPLPLGGLLIAKRLGRPLALQIQQVIKASILFARANPESALPTMRRYAQEMEDRVLMQHVDLYVNDWTIDLGVIGKQALDAMFELASPSHPSATRLEILSE